MTMEANPTYIYSEELAGRTGGKKNGGKKNGGKKNGGKKWRDEPLVPVGDTNRD